MNLSGLTLLKNRNVNENALTCFLRQSSLPGSWFKNKAALENRKKNQQKTQTNFNTSINITVSRGHFVVLLFQCFMKQIICTELPAS